MKFIVFIFCIITLNSNITWAKGYGEYDVKKSLTITNTKDGSKYGLDFQYIDLVINDLALHAKNYPPKFDSNADQKRAINDAGILSGILDVIVNSPIESPELLERTTLLNSIGHNLDISGAAQKADRDFKRLLELLPDDPKSNFTYGAFLGNTNRGGEALAYLNRSIRNGGTDAYYALGMAYLTMNNSKLALHNFEQYRKHNPKDKGLSKIIDAIKTGNIKVNTK